jgi:predicted deacetylase
MTNGAHSAARYAIRFDDICPSMNWAIWREIETTMDDLGLKPVVAVVPDNIDRELQWEKPRQDFWCRVREWRDKGWTIGIHGYQHHYETQDSGLLRLNRRSEFAGISYARQFAKLRSAVSIFHREQLDPKVWIAPSHSFDRITIAALMELGVHTISDGLSRWPYKDPDDMLWIPQQIWRLREMPAGMWTVCYHHNSWTECDLFRFRNDVRRFLSRILPFCDIPREFADRRRTVGDRVHALAMRNVIRLLAMIPQRPMAGKASAL